MRRHDHTRELPARLNSKNWYLLNGITEKLLIITSSQHADDSLMRTRNISLKRLLANNKVAKRMQLGGLAEDTKPSLQAQMLVDRSACAVAMGQDSAGPEQQFPQSSLC